VTAKTPAVWPLGPRIAARAERQAAGLGATEPRGPASQAPATAGRPSVAVANVDILDRRPARQRPEERHAPPCLLVHDATPKAVPVASVGWPEERAVPPTNWSDDETTPTVALLLQGLGR